MAKKIQITVHSSMDTDPNSIAEILTAIAENLRNDGQHNTGYAEDDKGLTMADYSIRELVS